MLWRTAHCRGEVGRSCHMVGQRLRVVGDADFGRCWCGAVQHGQLAARVRRGKRRGAPEGVCLGCSAHLPDDVPLRLGGHVGGGPGPQPTRVHIDHQGAGLLRLAHEPECWHPGLGLRTGGVHGGLFGGLPPDRAALGLVQGHLGNDINAGPEPHRRPNVLGRCKCAGDHHGLREHEGPRARLEHHQFVFGRGPHCLEHRDAHLHGYGADDDAEWGLCRLLRWLVDDHGLRLGGVRNLRRRLGDVHSHGLRQHQASRVRVGRKPHVHHLRVSAHRNRSGHLCHLVDGARCREVFGQRWYRGKGGACGGPTRRYSVRHHLRLLHPSCI
mmetsp:Transcript_71087/g.187560  ORF Transcript_71087/g.187560 Transcript_71087/m.187560 type:complete len:327 (+) Transcript_71087:336-1316(+)